MALTASNTKKVYAKATSSAPSSGDEITKVTNATDPWTRDTVETTGFSDDIYKTAFPTLIDVAISVDGFEDMSDAPQSIIRAALLSGATIYLTILHDGTNGWTYPVVVGSYEKKGAVADANQFVAGMKLNGAPTARP